MSQHTRTAVRCCFYEVMLLSALDKLRYLFSRSYYNVNFSPTIPNIEGMTARRLYATQANLHAVVSFLADSVAQLPLKVYVREGESERKRDRTSTAARLLWQPNPDQTAYELINCFVSEYLLFGEVNLWLLPDANSPSGYQLRIIPDEWILERKGDTNYAPDTIVVMASGGNQIELNRSEFIPFKMYSPGNPGGSMSPISALKQTLSEQIQADKFRSAVWSSSGRFNAYISRPKDVQPWDDEQRSRFAEAFRSAWGAGGENAGKMPLLEDGMEIKPYQFNAQQAQYAETKQLSREDVAAAYHVNPSLIWHTTTQTYASAKDNARALYADCLGPLLQMIQQRINSFLLPMVGADPNTYVEFDLTEKLKGSFEERASILQRAVGGPWMTRNEARADNNLPAVEGGDKLITPLNVLIGGQASPQDTHMDSPKAADVESAKAEPQTVRIKARSSREEDERVTDMLIRFFRRQAKSILPKIGAGGNWWDEDRWNAELADDIEPLITEIATTHGEETANAIGSEYIAAQTENYLRVVAENRAKAINDKTREHLQSAVDSDDEENTPAKVFETRENAHAAVIGGAIALFAAGWSSVKEAPEQARQQGIRKKVEKMWVTGENPRESHASINGETVPIDEKFSNGAYWPGDDNLSADESCGCNCSTEIIITEE